VPVPAPHERKQLHESECNSHESEKVPTTNAILTQKTSKLLIVNYFRQTILTTKQVFKKKHAANRLVTMTNPFLW